MAPVLAKALKTQIPTTPHVLLFLFLVSLSCFRPIGLLQQASATSTFSLVTFSYMRPPGGWRYVLNIVSAVLFGPNELQFPHGNISHRLGVLPLESEQFLLYINTGGPRKRHYLYFGRVQRSSSQFAAATFCCVSICFFAS